MSSQAEQRFNPHVDYNRAFLERSLPSGHVDASSIASSSNLSCLPPLPPGPKEAPPAREISRVPCYPVDPYSSNRNQSWSYNGAESFPSGSMLPMPAPPSYWRHHPAGYPHHQPIMAPYPPRSQIPPHCYPQNPLLYPPRNVQNNYPYHVAPP